MERITLPLSLSIGNPAPLVSQT